MGACPMSTAKRSCSAERESPTRRQQRQRVADEAVTQLPPRPRGKHGRTLAKKVFVVPRDIDLEIARLKLSSMGVAIDELTSAQREYLASWTHGT